LCACCAVRVFDRNSHSKTPLSFMPLLRLNILHAFEQWHSSRMFTPVTCWHCKLHPNTEGESCVGNPVWNHCAAKGKCAQPSVCVHSIYIPCWISAVQGRTNIHDPRARCSSLSISQLPLATNIHDPRARCPFSDRNLHSMMTGIGSHTCSLEVLPSV
jgi:hypothetical protein